MAIVFQEDWLVLKQNSGAMLPDNYTRPPDPLDSDYPYVIHSEAVKTVNVGGIHWLTTDRSLGLDPSSAGIWMSAIPNSSGWDATTGSFEVTYKLTADAWNDDEAYYYPMFALFSVDGYEIISLNAAFDWPSGDATWYCDVNTYSSSVNDDSFILDRATYLNQTVVLRFEWQCGSSFGSVADGFVRVKLNGTTIYEFLDISFYIADDNHAAGFRLGYAGLFGDVAHIVINDTVEDVVEPEPPEVSFNNEEIASVGLTWVEFTDSSGVMHPWANIALPDPATYYGGYKDHRVLNWNPIRRGLSDIIGTYEGIAWSWVMADIDRKIRRMLANEATKWFFNRNVVARTITDPGRRAQQVPRTIFRGVVRDYQPASQGVFAFAVEDYLVTTFQIGTDEQQCPKRNITLADFPNCPEDNVGLPVPIIYGLMTDKNEQTHYVAGTPGTVGLQKPKNLTATVIGGAGSSSYTYGVTALDNRNKQYNVYSKRTDHAGETDAAYVTVTNAPSLSQMSASRYVKLNWTDVPNAHHYRIYGRAVNGGTSLNLLDSARGPLAGTPERYNDGERHGETEVDREKTDSHPPKTNNTIVAGTPDSSYVTDTGRGVVPAIYVGPRDLGGAGVWHEFLVCGHAVSAITAVYQADVENEVDPPEQTIILIDPSQINDAYVKAVAPVTNPGGIRIADAECNAGANLLVPTIGTGWASVFGAPVYRDINGHRYTVIYARGVIGEKASLDEQPLFVNVHGIETVGDGTGTVLTNMIDQYLHALQNWLIGNYQTGPWLSSPVFPDEPTLPQINAESFAKAKAVSEARVPGGYVGAANFGLDGNFQSVRDAIAKFNLCADVNSGFNFKTQFMVSMQAEDITGLGLSQSVTQTRDILRDSFSVQSLVAEFFNRVPFMYGILPESGTFILYSEVKDPDSITKSLETRSAAIRELPFVRSAPVAFDIASRFLLRSSEVPRKASWQMGMSGLNFELGDIVLVTHIDGIGENGYEATPMRVTRQDYDPQNFTVSVEAYDVGIFFSDVFLLGDETALPALWTDANPTQRTFGYLADDVTTTFGDGARGKRLR